MTETGKPVHRIEHFGEISGSSFYEKLNQVLGANGFDEFVEGLCQRCYAPHMGRKGIPPTRRQCPGLELATPRRSPSLLRSSIFRSRSPARNCLQNRQ